MDQIESILKSVCPFLVSSCCGQVFLLQKYFRRKESILQARFSPLGKMFNWFFLGPSLAWQTSCLIATGSSRFQACNLCRELRCSVIRKEEVIPPQPNVATYQNNRRLGNDWQVDLQYPVGYKFTIIKHLVGIVTSLIYTQLHLLPYLPGYQSQVGNDGRECFGLRCDWSKVWQLHKKPPTQRLHKEFSGDSRSTVQGLKIWTYITDKTIKL